MNMGQSSIECILVGSPGVVCDLKACLVLSSIVVNVDVRALIESVVEGFGGRRSEIIVDVGKAIEFTQSELSRVSIDDVCGGKSAPLTPSKEPPRRVVEAWLGVSLGKQRVTREQGKNGKDVLTICSCL